MKLFISQFQKEFSIYFYGLNAYIILGAYTVLSLFSALYLGNYFVRETDVMNAFFTTQPFILILTIPAVTMRSWSDEIKTGTIELLLTQPISYFTLTFAKFAAAYTFFICAITFSLPLLIVSNAFSIIDSGVIFSSYAGLLSCGALFSAAGCFTSVLCRNNIISYIATIFLLFVITQLQFSPVSGENLHIPFEIMNFSNNYDAFVAGFVTWGNAAYFFIGTITFLWMNTFFLSFRLIDGRKKEKALLALLAALVFFFAVGSLRLFYNNPHDFTKTQRYTLLHENRKYLQNLDKRINVTLYESQIKRSDLNSDYAARARHVERLLMQIEHFSFGSVRYEIIQTEALSPLERRLIQEEIPYEEDSTGNKIYMVADISDNEGNHLRINAFAPFRQNLIETDIIRSFKLLGEEKKNIAIIASSEDLEQMQAFNHAINEFYNTDYLKSDIFYLPQIYDAAVVINPVYPSTQFTLALEQYVLNGGSLIFFHKPELLKQNHNRPFITFLDTFGIRALFDEEHLATKREIKFAQTNTESLFSNIETVVMNDTAGINTKPAKAYTTKPLLSIGDKTSALVSYGKYATNYPDLAAQSENITRFSKKDGKVYFIYDSDIIMDYLFISDLSKGHGFYQAVPTADNMFFILNLLDNATNSGIEEGMAYRRYSVNQTSIGLYILNFIKERYADQIAKLTQQAESYRKRSNDFANILKNKEFSSIRQMGNINKIAQKIDEIIDELNRFQKMINTEYELYTANLTVLLMLIMPFIMLSLLWIILWGIQKRKLAKIRRLTDDK